MTKATNRESGFALALTLVLMALIVIVVVAYLVSTRIERSTSSVAANRVRAQITAESGLTAAIHLLKDNTRYGNYITAMPAPSPAPSSIYTEIYRPADSTDPNHGTQANDYLRLDNAAGEILVSRGLATTSTGPDPRPLPDVVPSPLASASPFTIPSPSPAFIEERLPPRVSPTPTGNSYNFNQIVGVGSTTGRLVQPSPAGSPGPPPALGQWVTIRNNATPPEVVGRYAFFIEDESMKVNVDVAGNTSSFRNNDLASPGPSPAPNQIQEIDPGALLPMASPIPNRIVANSTLAALGATGGRLSTRSTLGLLTEWKITFPEYAHMTTVVSRDDNTTARGWQRLDLNALAAGLSTPAQKKPIATRIANWIRDAWTGSTQLSGIQGSQLFGNDRWRQQLAANIVDYIAPAGPPTDMGDVTPDASAAPNPTAVAVVGIERIPYLHSIEIIFQALNTSPPPGNSPGPHTSTVKMKLQFRFLNLFESDLNLSDQIGSIKVTGLPIITKKNNGNLLDLSTQPFTATVAPSPAQTTDLRPVNGTGMLVPHGIDGTSSSGARTFQTDWLTTNTVSYTAPATASSDERPRFTGGTLSVKVFGKNNERVDIIAVTRSPGLTGYYYNGSTSTGDFVEDAISTNEPLQIASINLTDGMGSSVPFGDPRYRGATLESRWNNDTRTDATCCPTCTPPDSCAWLSGTIKQNRISAFLDQAELNARSFGFDWYDSGGDRPLAFIRNGPMLNIGELGNIAACEYPWRTIYLQHPERPANSNQTGPVTDIPVRRKQSLDYVLVDLFRAGGSITRNGAININTQQQYLPVGGATTSSPLESLFVGVPLGLPGVTPTPQPLGQATPAAASPTPSPADRLSNGVNLLVSSTTVPPTGSNWQGTLPLNYRVSSISNKRVALSGETPTSDNNPPRPYFQIGELAPTLSRLVSASEASDSSSSSNTSHVVYSALRTNANPISIVPPSQPIAANANYKRDFEVEQAFREVSNSITTRGNVFRVLYVGQALKNGAVQAEYLGEAFVKRQAVFTQDPSNSDIIRTTDSTYRVLSNRIVTE